MDATIRKCVDAMMEEFPDVSKDKLIHGQTLEQRCEAWIMHAIERVETEVEGVDDEDWDEEDGDEEYDDEDE